MRCLYPPRLRPPRTQVSKGRAPGQCAVLPPWEGLASGIHKVSSKMAACSSQRGSALQRTRAARPARGQWQGCGAGLRTAGRLLPDGGSLSPLLPGSHCPQGAGRACAGALGHGLGCGPCCFTPLSPNSSCVWKVVSTCGRCPVAPSSTARPWGHQCPRALREQGPGIREVFSSSVLPCWVMGAPSFARLVPGSCPPWALLRGGPFCPQGSLLLLVACLWLTLKKEGVL